MVQINEHQHANRVGVCSGVSAGIFVSGQGYFQAVHQQLPVGQLRQRVVESQVLDLVFSRLAFGDVTRHGNPMGQAAIEIIDRHNVQLDPVQFAVFLVVDQLCPDRLRLQQRCTNPVEFRALR